MKIFITGATGFIGNQLINRLSNTDHQLYCLVRSSSPAAEGLKAMGINVVEGDVRDKVSLLKGMTGCDWVINLAGHYSFWEPDNRIYHETNVLGTRNVMESALETKVSKVIHVSTAVIFGKPAENPFNEESAPGPERFSRYARTKYEGDMIVWSMYKDYGLPVVVVYPAPVCGPGDPKASGQYVSDLINKRLPVTVLKNSRLTFVHVRDVADAIVRAAEKPDNIGERYLIGQQPVKFWEVNRMVSEISGVSLPKISMPDFLTMANAYILTGLSRLTGKKPLWGMSVDQMKTMKQGLSLDGSKAERELGLTYTPFRTALEEKIAGELKNHPQKNL